MWKWWMRRRPIRWTLRERGPQATFVTNVYVPDALVQVVQPTPVRVTVIMEKSAPGGERALSASVAAPEGAFDSCHYRLSSLGAGIFNSGHDSDLAAF